MRKENGTFQCYYKQNKNKLGNSETAGAFLATTAKPPNAYPALSYESI
ncbi:hypothetical protein FM107_08680 [Sphingobacterium sp. JB170]|nr:hypothetical protein FM107_08680 [Sphingobacterium sp. JB170]